MNKVSVIFYYWIVIIVACITAKKLGYGDNNLAILIGILILSVIYFGVLLIHKKQKNKLK